MDQLELPRIERIQGEVQLPGSKSLSNRTLLLAALASGSTSVVNILVRTASAKQITCLQEELVQTAAAPRCVAVCHGTALLARGLSNLSWLQDSEDVRYMVTALQQLGVAVREDWQAHQLQVTGCKGRFPSTGGELLLGNAGTAMRCAQVCCLAVQSCLLQLQLISCAAPALSEHAATGGKLFLGNTGTAVRCAQVCCLAVQLQTSCFWQRVFTGQQWGSYAAPCGLLCTAVGARVHASKREHSLLHAEFCTRRRCRCMCGCGGSCCWHLATANSSAARAHALAADHTT